MLPSKAVGRYSYQLVALSDMMETGAQGFPPKNGPPVFQAAEDKAPGLQPASVQQHGAIQTRTDDHYTDDKSELSLAEWIGK